MTVNWVSPNLGSDTQTTAGDFLSSRFNLSAGTYYIQVNDKNNESSIVSISTLSPKTSCGYDKLTFILKSLFILVNLS
jgi:hypothetical protein